MRTHPAGHAPDPHPLPLTGERTLPGIPDERYWFERHVVAYRLAAARAVDRVVLDAGCGEGYGLRMLAEAGARRVVGADYDETTVAHVEATYVAADPRIEVHRAELLDLPLADGEVDLVVSFQVIEHLYDIPGYLRSLARVTRPGGEVLIATPNRLTFTPGSDTPVNPFHTREFTAEELRRECEGAGLEVPLLLGVHHGPRLAAVERAMRRPFWTTMAEQPSTEWSRAYRALVHRVTADDFRVRPDGLDASLDLLAVCRVPRR
ncbi:MAG: class I SAM-dependent methyltransferase [Actinomycetes bacterium]